MRVSAAMAAVVTDTDSSKLRNDALKIYCEIQGNTNATNDTAEARTVTLYADFKPRVMSVLWEFVSSSSFQDINPSHADAEHLLHVMRMHQPAVGNDAPA